MKNLFKMLIAVVAMTCAASVYASGTLTVTASTGGTVTVVDGGSGDQCADPGCVTFVGAVGIWSINVDTGLTKPAIGTASTPEMDLSYDTSTRNATASTLTIDWSDSGFAAGTYNATDLLGGTQTAGMTTTDNVYVNGVLVFTIGPTGATSFNGSASGTIILTSADVVTLEMVITKGTTNGTTSFTATGNKDLTLVPDGGSAVALLGIALAGIEGVRRMIRARKA